MRLPNGYGTCYKLPGNRRKPYIARAFVDRDENGRSIYQTIGYFETRREGMDALVRHRDNPVTPKANITLGELYEEWSSKKYQKSERKKCISESTANNYRAAWKHIKNFENGRYIKQQFKELRTAHWQKIIDKCDEDGLSRSSLAKIKILAGLLYGYAIQNDVANKNYAEFLELPGTESAKQERFTDLEVKRIRDAADIVPWADTVLILIRTGMRISEMLNLTRFNVNLEHGLITGGIKTDAGKDRVVPIHPDIIKYIRKWHGKGGERLICDERGRPLSAKSYREKLYYPALEAVGVRKLTPHKCRHTFGSLLAEAGVDPLYIQKLIGHSDYAFTANTYAHPEVDALKKAINKMR